MDPISYTGHEFGVEVPADTLRLDLKVQRAIIASRLRKMTANFNPDGVGELLVSRRPDGLYIIDGQHRQRTVLAKHNGTGPVPTVTCEIYTGLSQEDEARLFLLRNDRAGVSGVDRDRNLNTMGDVQTLEVQMAAQAAGYVFVANSAAESTFRDRAAALQIMREAESKSWVAHTGSQHLSRVLKLYARAYGTTDRPESIVLKAISKILTDRRITDLDTARLEDVLRATPASQIVHNARQEQAVMSAVRGISVITAAVRVLSDLYNRGLGPNSRYRIKVTR
jgi:Family of unknown function (DUF6551)